MNRNHEWEKKRAEKVNVKDAKIVNHEPQITNITATHELSNTRCSVMRCSVAWLVCHSRPSFSFFSFFLNKT